MSTEADREEAVARCLETVRSLFGEKGVSHRSLNEAKHVLVSLAERSDLFPDETFPPPAEGERSAIYLLSEDPDHTNALYVVSERAGIESPPHDHKTWAVIAGVRGEEVNRLFERQDDGSEPGRGSVRHRFTVAIKKGIGIGYMPEDIHSIHCTTDKPTVTLHLYGRAIDKQTGRIRFDTDSGIVEPFAPNEIRR